ncbi:hypothetical protein GCM10010293_68810 [Streptomyces griseoflavus]|nr:hypothetical protein GCM10010293_68810 [Streptomyces griseoflavus]
MDPVRCTTSTRDHSAPSLTSPRRKALALSGGRSKSDQRFRFGSCSEASRGVMQATLGVGNAALPK